VTAASIHHDHGTGGLAAVPALEVRALSAGYGDSIVLRDVSLTVPAGAVVAMLGANGAGKSTLLRTVSGFLRARHGHVLVHGHNVTAIRPHQRAELGLCHIPEGRGIYRSLTVRENLAVQATRSQAELAVERAVAAFPVLGTRLGQRAGTLSGGEQQMLALAAAYVRQPSLILVDEASLGLAPVLVEEVFAFLGSRADAGTSILLVDQFATRALQLARHAYVLRKGRIVFDGAAQDLLDGDVFEHYLGSAAGGEAPVR
jgi:branched-chain amino acid transport system ATP-binding protein